MSHRAAKRIRAQMTMFMGADFKEPRKYSIKAPTVSQLTGELVSRGGIHNTPGTARAIYQIAKRNFKRHRRGQQAVRQGQEK